jgi:hypothetical protein
MEDLLFIIPIELQEDIDTKTSSIINNTNKEFERVDNDIITNNNETSINFEAVRVDINLNAEKIKIIEEQTSEAGNELENKVDILTERVSFTESIHNESIKKRIDGLLHESSSLSNKCDEIINELQNIKEIPLIGENEDNRARIENEIDKLKSRFTNIDSFNYTIVKLYDKLKSDIAYIYSDVEKDNNTKSPLITQFEKDELFSKCDELDKELQKITLFKDNNSLWLQSNEIIISKWDDYTKVIQSVTKIDEFTKQLDIILQEKEKISVVQDNFDKLKLDITGINEKLTTIDTEIAEVKKDSFEEIDVSEMESKRPRSSVVSTRGNYHLFIYFYIFIIKTFIIIFILGNSARGLNEPFANMELALQPVMRDILDLNSKLGTSTAVNINQQTEHLIRDIMQMYVNLASIQGGFKHKSRPNSSKVSSRKPSFSEIHVNMNANEFECIGEIDSEGLITINTSEPTKVEEGSLVAINNGEYKGRKGVVHLDNLDISNSRNITPKSDDENKHSARFNADPTNPIPIESESKLDFDSDINVLDVENNPKIHIHLFEDIPANDIFEEQIIDEKSNLDMQLPAINDNEYNTPSNSEIEMLREEIKKVGFSVESINRNKIDLDKAHLLLSNKADYESLEHKVDIDMLAIVENSLNKVIFDLDDNKESQLKHISDLKNQMREAMTRAINKAMDDADEAKTTMLAAKSLCFGCGRSSYVKSTASGNEKTGFTNTLNSLVLPGSDIIRGGFRMPVRINSPIPVPRGRQPIDVQFEDSIDGIPVTLTTDSSELYPEVDAITTNTNSYMSNNVHDSDIQVYLPNELGNNGDRKISTAAKAVRRAQGNDDGTLLRPILRKGFPGKKSLRAETVYAPERFDLAHNVSPNISVMSSSIPINPRNIRTAEGNRPRMGQSNIF